MLSVKHRIFLPAKIIRRKESSSEAQTIMTRLLEQAFVEANQLPDDEQDALAKFLLEELASERRWSRAFADSQDFLSQLADEALTEHQAGKTQALDPETL
jgi:hypothetical protein